MRNKIIVIGSLAVLLVFGFLYFQNNILIADDKDGSKDCSSSCTKSSSAENSAEKKSSCTGSNENMSGANSDASGNFAVYEFVTDKISCNDCKAGITKKLMGVNGVKEVTYGETCNVSKMTSVKVFYSDKDTTPELISASVKENGYECDKSKCGDGSKCTGKNKTEKKS